MKGTTIFFQTVVVMALTGVCTIMHHQRNTFVAESLDDAMAACEFRIREPGAFTEKEWAALGCPWWMNMYIMPITISVFVSSVALCVELLVMLLLLLRVTETISAAHGLIFHICFLSLPEFVVARHVQERLKKARHTTTAPLSHSAQHTP